MRKPFHIEPSNKVIAENLRTALDAFNKQLILAQQKGLVVDLEIEPLLAYIKKSNEWIPFPDDEWKKQGFSEQPIKVYLKSIR